MTPETKEQIINLVMPKFKSVLTSCSKYAEEFVAFYDKAMEHGQIRHRANLLLGDDHEYIRFQMEELQRDCMVGLRLIDIVEDKNKVLVKDIDRVRKFLNKHCKKTNELFSKSRLLSERFRESLETLDSSDF